MVRFWIAGLVLVLVAGGVLWLWNVRRPELTPAMRGARLAHELGCEACHGPGGRGGVPDPAAPGTSLPGWDPATVAMYVRGRQDFVDWIRLGHRTGEPAKHPVVVPMPAYPQLSDRQVADLVAFLEAVAWWTPDIPEAAWRGRAAAARLGCFGCHGPSGMGGTPNPGSLVGHVPAWDGREYEQLVLDEAELREWILAGRPARLWNDPLARRFLTQQTIAMPAYRDLISDHDLDQIVYYLRWLRAGVAAR